MLNTPEFIITENYPIDDATSPIRRALVARCHQDLDDQSICILEGSVGHEIVLRMAEETAKLAESAYNKENMRTANGWMYNRDFPEFHPRAAVFHNSSSVVLAHQFPGHTLIEAFYHWDAPTKFVREALGFKTLYRCACPHLSLMLSAMENGGQNGWHFDTNDGVVSLLLQSPDQGGEF